MSIKAPVTDDEFRAVMGSIATPVAVVTTFDGERPHGTTVSAFMSLSVDPPMVVVSLDRLSNVLRHITAARRFGVSVLAAPQVDTATALASKAPDKFDRVAWHVDSGLPRIDGAGSWIACDVAGLLEGGDHMLVLGNPVSLQHTPQAPMTYQRGKFGTHTPAAVHHD